MIESENNYKKFIFLGIVIISLGITFTNTLKDSVGALGIVFISVGGLLIIIGLSKKRKAEETEKK